MESVALIETAARAVLGDRAIEAVEQSLGGEDFAWYLEKVPGALFRLGVRTPGDTRANDLHQGTFDVDEDAIGIGVRVLVAAAMLELAVGDG
jgi:amidohydrolase